MGDRPWDWSQWVSLAEWWHNTNFHASFKLTPYEVVYKQLPMWLLPYETKTTQVLAVDATLRTRYERVYKQLQVFDFGNARHTESYFDFSLRI